MSVWDDAANAEVSENQGGSYLGYDEATRSPGTHKVSINAVKAITSRKGEDLLIVETTILESNVHPEGYNASQAIKLGWDSGPRMVKEFVTAALGRERGEGVTKDEIVASFAPDQPHCGKVMVVDVPPPRKESSKFTVPRWSKWRGERADNSKPVPKAFPPAGWTAHPDAPGYYYNGSDVKSEAELRAL